MAAVGFLTTATALGATPDEGHKYIRRLRAITVKHMGDLWAAQVTRRREADDSEVMEDLQQQWHDVRRPEVHAAHADVGGRSQDTRVPNP